METQWPFLARHEAIGERAVVWHIQLSVNMTLP
jgi:hypothetical protein